MSAIRLSIINVALLVPLGFLFLCQGCVSGALTQPHNRVTLFFDLVEANKIILHCASTNAKFSDDNRLRVVYCVRNRFRNESVLLKCGPQSLLTCGAPTVYPIIMSNSVPLLGSAGGRTYGMYEREIFVRLWPTWRDTNRKVSDLTVISPWSEYSQAVEFVIPLTEDASGVRIEFDVKIEYMPNMTQPAISAGCAGFFDIRNNRYISMEITESKGIELKDKGSIGVN